MLVAALSVDGYKASWGVCVGPAREAPVRVHPQRAAGSTEVIVGSSPKRAGKLPHSDELRDAGAGGEGDGLDKEVAAGSPVQVGRRHCKEEVRDRAGQGSRLVLASHMSQTTSSLGPQRWPRVRTEGRDRAS